MTIVSVACTGDSWTYASGSYIYKSFGIASDAPKGQYPAARVGIAYYPTSNVIFKNYAMSGWRLTDLLTQAPELDALIPSGYSAVSGRAARKFLLCVLVGINVSDANPTTFAASVGSYCLARKAAGWNKILLGTLPARGDGVTANFDTSYKTPYNNIIKGAGWASANGVDTIVDCTSIAEISSDGAYDNVAYSSYWNADNVHLTDAGHELWKVPWQAAIEAAIAALS